MEHNHSHSHHHHSEQNILLAFILNAVFTVVEIIGGIISGSTAILSDAIHDLSDTLALATSFVLQKMSKKRATPKFSFGFKRLTVLGALLNVIVLTAGSVFIISEVITHLQHPNAVNPEIMMVLAIFGIVVNGISCLKMKGSNKLLDKTVMLHLFEDLIGWVAVLVTSVIISITSLYILDPILSILIVGIILKNLYRSAKTIIEIIMNGTTDLKLAKRIKLMLLGTEGIIKIEDFHMWSEDGDYITVIAVLQTKSDKYNQILIEIKKELRKENITHSVIELKKQETN